MKPKLLIFSDDSLYFDGKECFAKNPLTELYNKLSAYFDIILSAPVKQLENKELMIYTRISDRIICNPRPFFNSVIDFFKKLPLILIPTLKNISKNIKDSNVVMLRLPSPIGWLAYFYSKLYSKPIFLYVAGNVKNVALKGKKYNPLLKPLVFLVTYFFDSLTKFMARKTLVFVNGQEMLSSLNTKYNKCINFIPSLIKKKDIFFRNDTCTKEPIKLIFVGRLVPIKGLIYLLKALKWLKSEKLNVILTIVGEGPQKKELLLLAKKLNIEKSVEFKTQIPFGEKLFKTYKESDIFVLPSLSEGIPKSILEAMAFGLPVIATNTGGIPDIIKNKENGLLVAPAEEKEISMAIEQIIRNPKLRKKIIKNGYNFVKNHTLEKQTKFMVNNIKEYFRLD